MTHPAIPDADLSAILGECGPDSSHARRSAAAALGRLATTLGQLQGASPRPVCLTGPSVAPALMAQPRNSEADAAAWAFIHNLLAEGRTVTITGPATSAPIADSAPTPASVDPPISPSRKRTRPPSAAPPARVHLRDPLAHLRRPNGLTHHGAVAVLEFVTALHSALADNVFHGSSDQLLLAYAPAAPGTSTGTSAAALDQALRSAGRHPLACPAWETLWALRGELDARLRELQHPWLLALRPDLHDRERRVPGSVMAITRDAYTEIAREAVCWLDRAVGRNWFSPSPRRYIPLSAAITNLFARPCRLRSEPNSHSLERRSTVLFPSNQYARDYSESYAPAAALRHHRRVPSPPSSDYDPEDSGPLASHTFQTTALGRMRIPRAWSRTLSGYSADGLDVLLCVGDALLRAEHRTGQPLAHVLASMWDLLDGAARPAGPARPFAATLLALHPLCQARFILRFMEISYDTHIRTPPETPSEAERLRLLAIGDYAVRFLAELLDIPVPPTPDTLPLAPTLAALRVALAAAAADGRLRGRPPASP